MATVQVLQNASQVLLMAILSLILIKLAGACSCAPVQYQTLFCSADLVIKGTIESKDFVYGEAAITNNEVYSSSQGSYSEVGMAPPQYQYPLFVIYNVTVEDVFRGEGATTTTTLRVTTPAMDSLCGITHLHEGEAYVISGFMWDGELNIGLCGSWVEPYKQLTGFQKRGLRRLYAKTCNDCKVCSPYDFHSNEICDSSNGCWDLFNSRCATRNTMCMRKPNGKCAWKKNKYVKRC